MQLHVDSAEGATAPETLRQKDRSPATTLKSCWHLSSARAPKEQAMRATRVVNLSGPEQRGRFGHATCMAELQPLDVLKAFLS